MRVEPPSRIGVTLSSSSRVRSGGSRSGDAADPGIGGVVVVGAVVGRGGSMTATRSGSVATAGARSGLVSGVASLSEVPVSRVAENARPPMATAPSTASAPSRRAFERRVFGDRTSIGLCPVWARIATSKSSSRTCRCSSARIGPMSGRAAATIWMGFTTGPLLRRRPVRSVARCLRRFRRFLSRWRCRQRAGGVLCARR